MEQNSNKSCIETAAAKIKGLSLSDRTVTKVVLKRYWSTDWVQHKPQNSNKSCIETTLGFRIRQFPQ